MEYTTKDLESFLQAYYEAMFFTEEDSLKEREIWEWELCIKTKSSSEDDAKKFLNSLSEDLETRDFAQLGHDFWMTRNRHGVGFWEFPDYSKEDSDLLMLAVKPFSEIYLYPNDYGFIDIG